MCGIAGIFSTTLEAKTIALKLEAMQEKISHRGPDGHGDFFSHSGQVALAHTRLAIIDLSSMASQPMSDQKHGLTISFNGEIYNHQALRQELTEKGVQFKTNSDTEVILALYRILGEACVSKLRGMFAFIIWDEEKKSVFAARDPLGIKPFYYWHDQYSFFCASELTSLLASKCTNNELDQNGLYSYLKTGTVSEPNTLISDAFVLPAGHYLQWCNGVTSVKPYWSIDFNTPRQTSHEQAIKTTREALVDSVKAHLVSDVPVGLFLSGGIDSTALLALASQYSPKAINTYSIAFESPLWNEGDLAKRVAAHFGANHTELVMTKEIAQSLFTQYTHAIDQPSIDGFNTFCVSKLAADHGQKVVLSGVGGDELFAGYKSFEILPKMLNASGKLKLFSPLIRFIQGLLNPLLSTKMRRVLDFLHQPNSLTAAHQSLRGIFSHDEAFELVRAYSNTNTITTACSQTNTAELSSTNTKDSISEIELTHYLRNQLLRDSDVMSMYWGLELRTPFVDSKLIDSISSIPADLRLEQGKKLLTAAVPEIPDWIVNRPKQGFRFPFDEWFSEQWQDSNNNINTPRWIKLTPWYRRWSLVVLNQWLERHAK